MLGVLWLITLIILFRKQAAPASRKNTKSTINFANRGMALKQQSMKLIITIYLVILLSFTKTNPNSNCKSWLSQKKPCQNCRSLLSPSIHDRLFWCLQRTLHWLWSERNATKDFHALKNFHAHQIGAHETCLKARRHLLCTTSLFDT